MKTVTVLALSAMAVVLTHCGTNDLSVTGQSLVPAAQIQSKETYGWSSKRFLNMQGGSRNDPAADAAIMRAVDQQMTAKGYRKVNAAQADLLVGYSAASRRVMETREVDNRNFETSPSRMDEEGGAIMPWNEVAPGTVDTKEFEEGTLLIDVKDRKTGKVLYRGSGQATLLQNPSEARSAARINNAVVGMLRPLPSRR